MQEMSPQGYWETFGGGSLKTVQRNFKLLTDYGWLRLVRTESLGDRRSRRRSTAQPNRPYSTTRPGAACPTRSDLR